MSSMTFSHGSDLGDTRSSLARLRAKFGPLGMVLALHLVLGYFIYSGMLNRMVDAALPEAVQVTFVEPPPAPKEIAAPAPKTVPLAKITPPVLPQVPVPEVQIAAPPVNTISVTPVSVPVANVPVPAAPVSAPAPVSTGPKTVTSGVEYIQSPQPVYPMMSKRMGEQGKVVLRVLINENGKAGQVMVQTSSGSARLDEAGRQAALRALYKPYLENGRPVAVYAFVPVDFQLAG
ncbi:MAG: energy transducer TonB [Massilia sp.]